jgi:hypothetical protein
MKLGRRKSGLIGYYCLGADTKWFAAVFTDFFKGMKRDKLRGVTQILECD